MVLVMVVDLHIRVCRSHFFLFLSFLVFLKVLLTELESLHGWLPCRDIVLLVGSV